MNERVLELRTQAAAWVAKNHQPQDPNAYSKKEIDQRYFMYEEKFAELIVRECGKYLESEAERLYALSAQESNPNFQSNFEICAEKCYDNIQGLKEHFGVEE